MENGKGAEGNAELRASPWEAASSAFLSAKPTVQQHRGVGRAGLLLPQLALETKTF